MLFPLHCLSAIGTGSQCLNQILKFFPKLGISLNVRPLSLTLCLLTITGLQKSLGGFRDCLGSLLPPVEVQRSAAATPDKCSTNTHYLNHTKW